MKALFTAMTVLAAGLAASACTGGFKNSEPAPVIYRITAPELASGELLAADLIVTVATTAPGLDNHLMATRWPGLRLDYYANTRWAASVPDMTQSAVIESLQGSRRLRSVQGQLGRFRATHVLTVEVLRFEADYTAGAVPVARVTFAATLGRHLDRQVLESWSVAAQEQASANRLTELVAALDAAFGRAATEMAARSFDAIGEDLARQPQGPPPR